jgi:hypothetical protein
MAEHKSQYKIQMSFGAQYDGKATFAEFQGDIKGVQNKLREVSEVSMHALGQIAVSFSGELAGSIRFAVGLMEELFKGGVWGIMAAGINLVVTSLVN